MGRAEGSLDRSGKQTVCDADRRSSNRVQPIRRGDPGRRIWRRYRNDLGLRHVGARSRGRREGAGQRRPEIQTQRQEAARLMGARPHAAAAVAVDQAS